VNQLPRIQRIAVFTALTLLFLVIQLPIAHGATVVSICDEFNLSTALSGGGTITFACSGIITVGSTKIISLNTTLDGGGQNVIIGGSSFYQIFQIENFVTFEVFNLTLTNAGTFGENGGAIGSADYTTTTINVSNSTFTNNRSESGGAIRASTVTISKSVFANNSASINGGAISGGNVTISNSTFTNNYGVIFGGAITSSNLMISNSTFTDNYTDNWGGAIWGTGNLTIVDSLFANNYTTLGANGVGAAIYFDPPPLPVEANIATSRFLNNGCFGTIIDNGGNLVNNAPGCPGEYSEFSDLNLDPAPPQCQETLDPAFAAPVGTYCQTLMRDGVYIGYPGTIPGELVDAGVIMAMEVVYYDAPGHATQSFPDDGNQQVCLMGEGRFI
jgi:predicted outer membrane repeat protein